MPKDLLEGIEPIKQPRDLLADIEKQPTDISFGKFQPKPSLYSLWGAEITPELKKAYPKSAKTAEILQEYAGTPLLHFLNMAALNQPRSLAAKFGYSYPEAKTLPGTILSKGAGALGLFKGPIMAKIMQAGKGLPVAKTGAGRILQSSLLGAAKGGTIGLAWAPEDISDLGTRIKQAEVGAAVGGTLSGAGAFLNELKNYPAEKTLSIRKGAKEYHKGEIKEYGKMLENLGKTGEQIESGNLLEKMTKMMVDRKLYDPINGKWVRPLNKIDAQLIKSYENLQRQINPKTGKLGIDIIIKEWEAIRNSGGKFTEPTQTGKIAFDTADEMMDAIKPYIKSDIFKTGQAKYADFKSNEEALNKYFNIWGKKWETARGEKFLTRGLKASKEAKTIGEITTKTTGETLKGAKTLSQINQLIRNPLFRWGLAGSLIGGGGILGFRGLNRRLNE